MKFKSNENTIRNFNKCKELISKFKIRIIDEISENDLVLLFTRKADNKQMLVYIQDGKGVGALEM